MTTDAILLEKTSMFEQLSWGRIQAGPPTSSLELLVFLFMRTDLETSRETRTVDWSMALLRSLQPCSVLPKLLHRDT